MNVYTKFELIAQSAAELWII